MKSKKLISIILVSLLIFGLLSGCGKSNEGFAYSEVINLTSREEGSGTRGAFIELFGIEKKDASGKKVDYSLDTAAVTNSTSVMMTTVANDLYSIGYLSLGSLNDTVKALDIDGAKARVENIENGTYKISRPFNIVTKASLSEAATDFINFIFSTEGQQVVSANGYIPLSTSTAYTSNGSTGKVVIAGSSSVTPVMEKLQEAYQKVNDMVTIEVQQSDSTTGVQSAISGICDIGMASRDLKDSETSQGVKATVIALDGIAVIVNNDNPLTGLTSDQVMQMYTGKITTWDGVKQ